MRRATQASGAAKTISPTMLTRSARDSRHPTEDCRRLYFLHQVREIEFQPFSRGTIGNIMTLIQKVHRITVDPGQQSLRFLSPLPSGRSLGLLFQTCAAVFVTSHQVLLFIFALLLEDLSIAVFQASVGNSTCFGIDRETLNALNPRVYT